jgi:hypothetical protein
MIKKILFLVFAISLVSCKKENVEDVQSDLTSKNGLVIVKLIDDGENYIKKVEEYHFTFSENRTVTAVKNNITTFGTYRVYKDDNKIELEMQFDENSDLEELNEDWTFFSKENGMLSFDEEDDFLVFKMK